MPFKRIDIDKAHHNVEPMYVFHNEKDDLFSVICPKCNGYTLLTVEQAAQLRSAQCFGKCVLFSWAKD
jgi:hypothetical protein